VLSALNAKVDLVTAAAAGEAKVVTLDPTTLKTFDFQLADGRCCDVVVALDAGGAGVDLRMVDGQSGEEFSLARGRLVAESRICASGRPRAVRGELRVGAGKTDALVVVRMAPVEAP
jgi:hypothetical protein